MGYEVEMYVGTVSSYGGGLRHFSIVGYVDLCKPEYDSEVGKLSKNPEVGDEYICFYGTDGNTKITEDAYGKSLKAINPEYILEALQLDKKTGYRGFDIAYALLESIMSNFSKDENIKVVLFGY